jgi:hypothetical protein
MALTFLGFSHLRQWRDDDYDYDVLEDGVVLGHIFFLDAVGQQGRPWMWASGHNGDIKRAAHGYEPTREAAMAVFAKSWRRGLGVVWVARQQAALRHWVKALRPSPGAGATLVGPSFPSGRTIANRPDGHFWPIAGLFNGCGYEPA